MAKSAGRPKKTKADKKLPITFYVPGRYLSAAREDAKEIQKKYSLIALGVPEQVIID